MRLGGEYRGGLENLAQHVFAGNSQPSIENGSVNLAEIDLVLEISKLQLGQIGVAANRPGFDLSPYQKDRGRRAVVGTMAGVLCCTTAEFGKRHEKQAVLVTAGSHILVKGCHGVAELLQQLGVRAELVGMSIEVPDRDVKDAHAKVGVDQLSGQLQMPSELSPRIGGFWLVTPSDLFQPLAAGVRVRCSPLHEVQ